MNALVVLLIGAVVLVLGYIFYGGWLAKQWGVEPDRPTPATELEDGVDYVPSKPYVVLGHHFSSIAGAGPINGPIQAAVFGWVPVFLWVLIGGIFFGAVHDFGALFASLRHKGHTIAAIIAENIDDTAKKLFCVFAYLTLVLVVAAFASIVANTFVVTASATPETNLANQRTAMISVLFIFVAVVYGFVTCGRNIPGPVNIVSAIVLIIALVAVGYNLPLISLDYTTWMIILGVYILIASVAPVWVLLQPRDYLSSYLLYGVIILAIIGIVGASVTGAAADMQMPASTGFFASNAAVDASGSVITSETGAAVVNKAAASGYLFPALFITIACGAISGFHSLVSSGTTSKQLEKESQAKPIGYGAMLIECLLAIISLCAVAFVWANYQAGGYASPTAVFASGLSQMLGCIPGLENVQDIAYTLLILAVSAFCLTSLDTATRLARYMFQELWLKGDETPEAVKSAPRRILANPYVSTIITVVAGIALGMTGYTLIWPLFGAANQLLAVLALLAVCAWLGNAGRNNKMFFIPMAFMLAVTLTSLCMTILQNAASLAAGGDPVSNGVQIIIAALLLVLAVILMIKGVKTLIAAGRKKAAESKADA